MDVQQLVPITSADLLQANVTIITGIFILLTISVLSQRANLRILLLILISPIPFIISTGFLILAPWAVNESWFYFGAGGIFLGALSYLVFTLILIAKAVKQTRQSS